MKVFAMRCVMMRRFGKLLGIVCLALCGLSFLTAAAEACPMCSQSIAEEDLLPHAYMYSILFMLGMPAMVFGGIGSVLFFKFRKFGAVVASGDAAEGLAPYGDVREPALTPPA